jgi:hypothetical protein
MSEQDLEAWLEEQEVPRELPFHTRTGESE